MYIYMMYISQYKSFDLIMKGGGDKRCPGNLKSWEGTLSAAGTHTHTRNKIEFYSFVVTVFVFYLVIKIIVFFCQPKRTASIERPKWRREDNRNQKLDNVRSPFCVSIQLSG